MKCSRIFQQIVISGIGVAVLSRMWHISGIFALMDGPSMLGTSMLSKLV